MSQQASTNFITSFDAMVKHAYQSAGVLDGTVRQKNGVTGSTHVFPKLGKGLAQQRIPQTDIVPMNIAHTKATAVLTDWSAAEYSDVYDLSKLPFDEKKELSYTVASAMGRRKDQLILDAMATGASATQVGVNVGGTNSGLNVEKILTAKRLMDDNDVPQENRYMAISARALEQALQETEIGSSDYNVLMPLMTGQLKTWAGFEFRMVSTRAEGGLSVATNVRNNFAYHKDAVGVANGINMRTEVHYIAEKTSHLINGLFSSGAIVIDNTGVYDVLTFES